MMNRFKKYFCFILFFLLFITFQTKAQFPNKDGRWFFSTPDPDGTYEWGSIVVEKDTIIGEYKYSILSKSEIFQAAFRSDSLKVYAIDLFSDDRNEFLIYDFGLSKDDTIQLLQALQHGGGLPLDTIYYYVYETGKITINNKLVNQISLQDIEHQRWMEWIEGIGSTSTPFYPQIFNEHEFTIKLDCYKEGLTQVYGYCNYTGTNQLSLKQNQCFYQGCTKELIFLTENNYRVKIVDTNGKLMYTDNNFCDKQLNLSFLKKGNYICILENAVINTSYKFSVY